MQSLQVNCEAESQTFFSFPPHCTREMVRKSSNSIGTIDGLSYQEYFENPHNVVLTASPRRLTRLISKQEEIVYKVSSVFDLDEENEVEISERQYTEDAEENEVEILAQEYTEDPEEKEVQISERQYMEEPEENEVEISEGQHTEEPEEISPKKCEEEENENTDMCTVEGPSVPKDSDKLENSNTSSSHYQGDVTSSQSPKDTLLTYGFETQIAKSLPNPSTDDTRVISSETAAPCRSDQSIVSSLKVEVGSQDTIKVNCTNSNDMVSFIDSSAVSKPLAQAHSEGKCKKKKKTSRSLKGVSKSVPHVVPNEMQQAADFSRIITQEEIYAEMSRGDDAFNQSLDQYDEDSSYSSESDNDDDSMAGSDETDESTNESNSPLCYQAPMVSPASPMTSQDNSESVLSREVGSNSEFTLRSEADNQDENEENFDTYCSASSETTLQLETGNDSETEKSVSEQSSANSEITTEYEASKQTATKKHINTCMKLPSSSTSTISRSRSPSPTNQLENTEQYLLPRCTKSTNNQYEADNQKAAKKHIITCMKLPPFSTSTISTDRSPSPTKQLEHTKKHLLSKSVESTNIPSPKSTLSGSSSPRELESPVEERECKSKRLEKLVEKLCQDFVTVTHTPPNLAPYFESANTVTRDQSEINVKCGVNILP